MNSSFPASFALPIFGVAMRIGTNCRDMSQCCDASICSGLGNNPRTDILNRIHISKAANQIDNSVGIRHRASNACRLANIRFHQLHLTQIAKRLYVVGAICIAARDANPGALAK